jgi:multimeric flavodoxin WrbA
MKYGLRKDRTMKVLVLNGSPRRDGTVAKLLGYITEWLGSDAELEWIDTCRLNIKACQGCMACRKNKVCELDVDDGHRVGRKIADADVLIVGTPTYWGNMCGPLKTLFDRNVSVFIEENNHRMPLAQQKGKKAVIVSACTTPWPWNFIRPESRGAVRAVKNILKSGGFKILGTLVKPGTKINSHISRNLVNKARRLAGAISKEPILVAVAH